MREWRSSTDGGVMILSLLIRFMLVLELCLVCAEDLVPGAHDVLPIGGSHVVQVGIALMSAFICNEIYEIWRSM